MSDVDISRERCERLAHNLRGDCNEATADLITALRAALDRAEADKAAAVGAMREVVAHAMWKAEADRAAPNVGKHRTLEMFANASEVERSKWHLLADAAIRALAPPPAARGQEVEALIEAAAFTWQGLVGEYGYQKARVNFGRLEDALDALAPFTGGKA